MQLAIQKVESIILGSYTKIAVTNNLKEKLLDGLIQ